MNLKRLISFIFPLTVLLISLGVYLSVSKITKTYEQSISNDYSIILITSSPIIENKVKELPSLDVKEIKHLKREKILNDLKSNLSNGSFKLLESKLPYFYTIYLKQFPTTSKLRQIKKELSTLSGIKKIETFSKDHDEVYSLLLLIKTIVTILFICIVIFTFFIISSHVKIWFFEHQERLEIIKLHGGSIFYGAKPIIKLAIISSIVSSIIVIGFIYFISKNLNMFFSVEIIEVITKYPIDYSSFEIVGVFILSFLLSFITVIGVLIKHRLK